MTDAPEPPTGPRPALSRFTPRDKRTWVAGAAILAVLAGGAVLAPRLFGGSGEAAATAPAATVGVSTPLQRDIQPRLEFLGQFAAINSVEIRAQVGGTLTQIRFRDGDVVHRGQVLFVIDPAPYQIRLAQASAELESANARLELATRQLERAQALRDSDAGSIENLDQKTAERAAAQAAVSAARASVRDAQFDLSRCVVRAPFTGRIGAHQVSVGNLVAGSRAASAPTTLLATIVSLDTMHLDFDMSEADYMTYQRQRASAQGAVSNGVEVGLADEGSYSRSGTMTFVDNTLDRSSGTIHARAVVPNPDGLLTPGGFGRVRLSLGASAPALLVPEAAVLSDQSDHIVMTVSPDNVVTPKVVQRGELRGNLRVIRSGLAPTDRVIIEGLPTAAPGAKVTPQIRQIPFDAAQFEG